MGQDPSMGHDPADHGGVPPNESGAGPPSTAAAGLGTRIGARILDALIVGIPVSIILSIAGLGATAFGVLSALVYYGYFVLMESSQGATLGKKILSLRVVGLDGGLPATDVAAKRNIWMLLGIVPFVGGLLSLIAVIIIIVTISQNPDNRGYHDTFAGTRVLR